VAGVNGDSGGRPGGQMKRRLFNLLAAVSLIAFFSSAAFWVWKAHQYREIRVSRKINEWREVWLSFSSYGGLLQFFRLVRLDPPVRLPRYSVDTNVEQQWVARDEGYFMCGHAYGFGCATVVWDYTREGAGIWRPTVVVFPTWLVMAMTATPLTGRIRLLVRRRVREARSRLGYCIMCAYDLRASKERCPECGTLKGLPSGAIPAGDARENSGRCVG